MSLTLRGIIELIVKDTIDLDFGVVCTVLSYDEEKQTVDCEPIDGRADFLGVRLQAEISPGLVYIPKVGSVVIVELTSPDSAFVSMWGEVEEVILLDGKNGGLVKVSELVSKLNNLENDVNTLKNVFSSWVTVPNDGGAALKTAAATWYGQSLTPTQNEDLENVKIKH